MEEQQHTLEQRMERVERIVAEAFPGGDHLAHRQYHEMMIEEGRDRKRLIAAIREKTIAGLVWGSMLGIGYACWKYLVVLVRGS